MKTHLLPLSLVAVLLMLGTPLAWANGTLTHLSGQVSVQKADGKTQPGAPGVQVSMGDTLITGQAGYVRVAMSDGGEMVLRPDSQLKVENYKFDKEAPADDSFVFSMLKGGLRTISGLISKRGNKDAYKLNTATATIGIRGTQFDVRVCLANCGALADGTYLAVQFGAVHATNAQGSLAVAAGQVAHVPPSQAPIMLARNPGIGFTPPAVIPKLDEKKKQAAAATSAVEPTAPAAAGTEKPAQSTERETPAKAESKPETKTETETKASPSELTQSVKQPEAPVTVTDTGVQCSVQ